MPSAPRARHVLSAVACPLPGCKYRYPGRRQISRFSGAALDEPLAHPPLAVAEELTAKRGEPSRCFLERPQDLVPLGQREPQELGLDVVCALEPHVRRVFVGGKLRPYGKTAGALRVVPLAQRALEALEAHRAGNPTSITPMLFTTRLGTPIDLHRWRARHWTPALRAAGLEHRGPYAMRHTFASWTIAAGLPTFEIATTTGPSLEQLSKTYAHLLPDSADRARVALDAYISNAAEAAGAEL